jgi:AhpD family alkylhydroperoxidase
MIQYSKQTLETASPGAAQALTRLKESAGVIPNLAATMSESPVLIDGFVTLREIYGRGTLDSKDRETLGVSNAVTNRCEWCVAFHSFVAAKIGVDPATVEAVRTGQAPADPRARALVQFGNRLIEKRGAVTAGELGEFIAAGFTKQQALEVVTGVALSLMANYAGNFVQPELDPFLAATKWSAAR